MYVCGYLLVCLWYEGLFLFFEGVCSSLSLWVVCGCMSVHVAMGGCMFVCLYVRVAVWVILVCVWLWVGVCSCMFVCVCVNMCGVYLCSRVFLCVSQCVAIWL